MPTRLLLISDTHLPKRAKVLPPEVWQAVDNADIVVHAGDWVEAPLLDELEARAKRLIAVWGNNDGDELRGRLPQIAHASIERLRFAVVHETGGAPHREERMDELFPDTDVLIFGHSHVPWQTRTESGLRLINPGSPTDRRRQPACTYMTAVVAGDEISVQLHSVPRR